jgi:hypothetical protein
LGNFVTKSTGKQCLKQVSCTVACSFFALRLALSCPFLPFGRVLASCLCLFFSFLISHFPLFFHKLHLYNFSLSHPQRDLYSRMYREIDRYKMSSDPEKIIWTKLNKLSPAGDFTAFVSSIKRKRNKFNANRSRRSGTSFSRIAFTQSRVIFTVHNHTFASCSAKSLSDLLSPACCCFSYKCSLSRFSILTPQQNTLFNIAHTARNHRTSTHSPTQRRPN